MEILLAEFVPLESRGFHLMSITRRIFTVGFLGLVSGLLSPISTEAQFFGGGERRQGPAFDAQAWVVSDAASGVVLDSVNATKRLQVGSITKIATAMVVLDWAAARGEDLGQLATVPGTITLLNSPNSVGLQVGDRISLREALYASLMQSDNQAAETIAAHVGEKLGGGNNEKASVDFFVAQMNALARKLGMRSTRFLNAHGLDDLEDKLPYSTAGDIALLANYAVGHSGFSFYTSQKSRKISWTTSTGETTGAQLTNTNEMLGGIIDGMKTGTTRRAGACVVITAAQRPENRQVGDQQIITPRRLTVVVLDSPSRFETARSLLDYGWKQLNDWAAAGRPAKGWRPRR
jgi:serine-type D-Ala-D-Ala carboxypeptidase (penicillin-binding protein 5/6)